MCLPYIVLVPHLPLPGSSLQLLCGFYLLKRGKHHQKEIESGSLALVSRITMWMRSPLILRIWGTSVVAERSKLYIPHPGAPNGKIEVFAAGWVLGGLTLTRRPVLHHLLLISALGPAFEWSPPGWCLPDRPQSTPGTGRNLQRNKKSVVH